MIKHVKGDYQVVSSKGRNLGEPHRTLETGEETPSARWSSSSVAGSDLVKEPLKHSKVSALAARM